MSTPTSPSRRTMLAGLAAAAAGVTAIGGSACAQEARPRSVRIGFQKGSAVLVQHPAVLAAVLEEIGKVTRWSGQHREELATLAAESTGIAVDAWSAAFARADFSFGPVTGQHVAQQQQLADRFHALRIIPRAIDVSKAVWTAPGA